MSSPQPLALQDFGPDLHVDVADAVPPPSVEILGIGLAITDYERTMDWMDATIVDGGRATSASRPPTPSWPAKRTPSCARRSWTPISPSPTASLSCGR